MTTSIANLKSGERLTIRIVEPPLGEYAPLVGCWSTIRDALLGGGMSESLATPYFIGELDGEVVGNMGCYLPTDTMDVGLVEFVATTEEHRQKGIASALLGALIEWFTSAGGQALNLCTTNPFAGSLYEKHGFWYSVGDGMRYLAPGAENFDRVYLGDSGTARVRPATWGDLPRASLLYNSPTPDWTVKDYLTSSFRDTRYERHFINLMKGAEDSRGAVIALESPGTSLVGLAAFHRTDSYMEQHVATLSFRVSPAYYGQAAELLEAGAREAAELSITLLQAYMAEGDGDQMELLEAAGFAQEARLHNRLRTPDGLVDMLVYSRQLAGNGEPTFGPGDYYAGRKPWQAERAAARNPRQLS
jgi:GNAT superfamily N-acetyltransferase